MALYEYSWLILLSPLFAFVVIIFGTRMWDLAERGRVAAIAAHEAAAHAGHNGHDESHSDVELMHEKGPHGEDLVFTMRPFFVHQLNIAVGFIVPIMPC